jgi:hypothetical protein
MRVLICLLLLPGLAMAEIYRWVDASGQVHFSQRPAPGAEQVEVKPQVMERDAATIESQERANRFFEARREEQTQAAAAVAERNAQREKECRELRSQLAGIPEGRRYYQSEGNGERSYYSDAELDVARSRLRDRISERCS